MQRTQFLALHPILGLTRKRYYALLFLSTRFSFARAFGLGTMPRGGVHSFPTPNNTLELQLCILSADQWRFLTFAYPACEIAWGHTQQVY